MTLIGIRMEAVPSTIGWDGLVVFARHLPQESATMRWALDSGDGWGGEWTGSFLTNELLSDVSDLLNVIRWNYQTVHSKGAKPKKPTPVERPWVESREKKHVGKGAISKKDFLRWYYDED